MPTKLKIRVWIAAGKNIGHVSLELPERSLYVSFWPDDNVSGLEAATSARATSHTYEQDISAEEKSEDETLEDTIDMDVNAMVSCWRELKANRRYSLAVFNCADAVKKVLAAGNVAFKDAFEIASTKRLLRNTILPVITPLGILDYALIRSPQEQRVLASLLISPFFVKVAYRIHNFKAHGLFSSISRYTIKI